MHRITPTFRHFYHFLLDGQPPDREPWRDLDHTKLLTWADHLLPVMQTLAVLAPVAARTLKKEQILEELYELYALSRVNDLLLLPFQPAASDEVEREQPVAPIVLADYLAFWERLGLQAETPQAFHPFTCELVTVEPAAAPDSPAQLVAVLWPALFFGDLLVSRAGVRVRAGGQQLDREIAATSPLLFTHRRRARPTDDLSKGWGHNSQWSTAFRRDYRDASTLHYNVDGRIDAWAHSPPHDTSSISRDHLSPRQRYSALVYRCRVLSTDPAYVEPGEIAGETVTEPGLDAAMLWCLPPPSDRDEDPERLTRWLWHTNPPLPANAPPLLGALTPGRFLRLLNRLSAERDVTQWVYDGDDLLTPEQVVITAMAGATDGWIYLIGPQYHYTHFELIPTSVPEPIPDDQVDAYVSDNPGAYTILDCTVGAPEQRRGNLVSLAPWLREHEETALKPLWEPVFTYSHDDQNNLSRLYAEVRTLAQADSDLYGEAQAVLRLGAALAALGDIPTGVALLEEAQSMADALGDQHLLANILGERGLAAARAGDRRHALDLLDQASGIAELAGDIEVAEVWAEQRDLVLSYEWPGADKG